MRGHGPVAARFDGERAEVSKFSGLFPWLANSGYVQHIQPLRHRTHIGLYGAATNCCQSAASNRLTMPVADCNTIPAVIKFRYSFAPGYRQSLFDPNNPYRFQFTQTECVGQHKPPPRAPPRKKPLITTRTTLDSVLPHVRSDFAVLYEGQRHRILTAVFRRICPTSIFW